MSWLEISIITSDHAISQLEKLLLKFGACSVTLQDAENTPVYEPDIGTTPLWSKIIIKGLFAIPTDLVNILATLYKADFCKIKQIKSVPDKKWELEYLQYFQPLQITKNLWICPEWTNPPDEQAINIILNPGCGFGTGSHPTTAMCLKWLGSNNINNKYVIDYGCGSGILAISAILLGAKQAMGIDIDHQALNTSRQNAELNNISKQLIVHHPQNIPEFSADIILANILTPILIQLAPSLIKLSKPRGILVLSGILESQIAQILATYSLFAWQPPIVQQQWVLLVGHHKDT